MGWQSRLQATLWPCSRGKSSRADHRDARASPGSGCSGGLVCLPRDARVSTSSARREPVNTLRVKSVSTPTILKGKPEGRLGPDNFNAVWRTHVAVFSSLGTNARRVQEALLAQRTRARSRRIAPPDGTRPWAHNPHSSVPTEDDALTELRPNLRIASSSLPRAARRRRRTACSRIFTGPRASRVSSRRRDCRSDVTLNRPPREHSVPAR